MSWLDEYHSSPYKTDIWRTQAYCHRTSRIPLSVSIWNNNLHCEDSLSANSNSIFLKWSSEEKNIESSMGHDTNCWLHRRLILGCACWPLSSSCTRVNISNCPLNTYIGRPSANATGTNLDSLSLPPSKTNNCSLIVPVRKNAHLTAWAEGGALWATPPSSTSTRSCLFCLLISPESGQFHWKTYFRRQNLHQLHEAPHRSSCLLPTNIPTNLSSILPSETHSKA